MFRGGKEYTPKQIQEMLSLSGTGRAAPRPGQPMPQGFGASRFLMPVSQCEFQLTGILEQLSRDPWPVANDKRALRCTGVALSVAVGLLEVSHDIVALITSSDVIRGFRPHSRKLERVSCSLLVVPPQKVLVWL